MGMTAYYMQYSGQALTKSQRNWTPAQLELEGLVIALFFMNVLKKYNINVLQINIFLK